MTQPASSLSVHDLACVRGHRTLFEHIHFTLSAGEWMYLRGSNGAGKTSMLRQLAGLAHPAAGSVRWNDEDIREAGDAYREALLFLGHHSALKEDLTPLENLCLAAALDGHTLDEGTALVALRRFGLKGREELPVKFLSQGQRRRVLLSRLLTRKASLWILDEPLAALDTRAVDLLGEVLADHVSRGGIAILTSHQAIPLPGGRELMLEGVA